MRHALANIKQRLGERTEIFVHGQHPAPLIIEILGCLGHLLLWARLALRYVRPSTSMASRLF
jgi:hypothetical protein